MMQMSGTEQLVESTSPDRAVPAIAYATPPERSAMRVWAAAAIVLAGLGLLVIGGCFLIGVLSIITPGLFFGPLTPGGTGSLTPAQFTLMVVLYVLAFASVAGGVVMLVTGARGLFLAMRD
ncbi:MAG TPA: hypothetical protein VGN72_08015 [Tepidisphaeraceae bacterium]|jgi:CBS domain containing-hemolysin-like protein|nr:hypothetical protein [Tepidisphaeraceae bacterium]